MLQHVTVEKICKLIHSLSNSKSTATDELDNFSVKLSADLIAKPLQSAPHSHAVHHAGEVSKLLEACQSASAAQKIEYFRNEKLQASGHSFPP